MIASRSCARLTWLLFAFLTTVSNAQTAQEEKNFPGMYFTERVLTGLKFKLTDNFTVGGWTAGYWGSSFYPTRTKSDPKVFLGYDIVPGFEVGVGKIFNKVKLSLGGDYYYLSRRYDWTAEPDVYHSRARGNIILTMPFAGKMTLQFIQRFERIYQRKVLFEKLTQQIVYMRKRSTLKVTGPQFSTLKIAPYAYYEGYHTVEPDQYYYETEFGVTLSPIENFTMNIADQIQSMPEMAGYVANQIILYLFYTIDLSR